MKKKAKAKQYWHLVGYDTFSNEWYNLDGVYRSLAAVEKAAQRRLELLEQRQPTASSGGQNGIQDRVFIETPDGQRYRWEWKHA